MATAEPPAHVALAAPEGAASLYAWAEPVGSDPLPPAFAEAGRRFHHAVEAFDAGRYLDAATGFLTAASLVPKDSHEFYVAGFTADREVAYRNAEIAFESAARRDLARDAFAHTLDGDPACTDTLRAILRRLAR